MKYKCIKGFVRKEEYQRGSFVGSIRVGEIVEMKTVHGTKYLEKDGRWVMNVNSPACKEYFEKIVSRETSNDIQSEAFIKEFCFTCNVCIVGKRAIEENDEDNIKYCEDVCKTCEENHGELWQPILKPMIDKHDLKEGMKLKDEENFIWVVTEIYNKKMVPELIKLECSDLMAVERLNVDELEGFSIVKE